MFKEIFNQSYPGQQRVLDELLKPLIGEYTAHNEDILKSNPAMQKLAEQANIKHIKRIADFELDDIPLNVFDITLSDNVRIKYSRVNIQKVVRSVMDFYSGAIMFFHTESNEGEWRISFVEKEDTQKSGTSAKRYTFLVGESQSVKTVNQRFEILKNTPKKSVEAIREAFSVEALSEEFFEKYKSHYEDFVQYISGKRFVKEKGKWVEKGIGQPSEGYISVFEGNDKSVRDFVKKMLGRIVFLHFLQKKRWLCEDENYLQNLFEKSDKNNYLENVLEPLFFGVLNTKSADRKVLFENENWDLSLLKEWENIPYLNGGLFEKDELDKKKVIFPESLFSDLFDFFSQYNFTIDENDPNDSEVGIDPEMLGKIFENLLEDNKDKGAFYTPKEIVQYMCRESLIAYLCEKHKDDEENIRYLVEHHIADWNEDTRKKILNSLKEVKICDPAIGSGAFPMGLLNELYKCRLALGEEKSVNIKKEIIQNNIYGVDIEKGAVDIAQLRFWLALVVEEENAEPLPNLDYKIMQGNSLLESYQGIDLGNIGKSNEMILASKGIIDLKDGDIALNIFDEVDIDRIGKLIHDYFSTTENKVEKRKEINTIVEGKIHSRIFLEKKKVESSIKIFFDLHKSVKISNVEELENAISKGKFKINGKEYKKYLSDIERLNELTKIENQLIEFQHQPERPYFLWHLFFADVFEKGGFDIVIGNPPYIQLQDDAGKLSKIYNNQGFETFARTGDIYQLFYEKGFQLLKQGGHLAYITSNKWMRAGYGEVTRKFFAKNTNPKILIDFGGIQIFESATVDTNILLFAKENNTFSTKAMVMGKDVKKEQLKNLSDYFRQKHSISKFSNDESWVILSEIEQRIKDKIEKVGVPLKDWDINIYRGILTGYNEAFIIDGSKRNEILANCQTENERQKTDELIRPILRGRDIKRYGYDFADLWLINTHNGVREKGITRINIEDYPAVKTHLDLYYPQLEKRADKGDTPYNLRNCAYIEEFSKQKIVYPETTQGAYFAYDENEMFLDKTCFMLITDKPKYLQNTLSSKLFEFAYKKIFSSIELGTAGYQYNKHALVKLPIKQPNLQEKKRIEEISVESLDKEIYKLYNLTNEEIDFIEKRGVI